MRRRVLWRLIWVDTVNALKFWTLNSILFWPQSCFMQLFLKIFSGMANSVYPDQTAPSGAVWSGSALFAYDIFSDTLLFKILGHLWYLADKISMTNGRMNEWTNDPKAICPTIKNADLWLITLYLILGKHRQKKSKPPKWKFLFIT